MNILLYGHANVEWYSKNNNIGMLDDCLQVYMVYFMYKVHVARSTNLNNS